VIIVKVGTVINGPNGQGYKVTRDIAKYDLVKEGDFEAFGGAPKAKAGRKMPAWVVSFVQGSR
jgi:hypothetical protein